MRHLVTPLRTVYWECLRCFDLFGLITSYTLGSLSLFLSFLFMYIIIASQVKKRMKKNEALILLCLFATSLRSHIFEGYNWHKKYSTEVKPEVSCLCRIFIICLINLFEQKQFSEAPLKGAFIQMEVECTYFFKVLIIAPTHSYQCVYDAVGFMLLHDFSKTLKISLWSTSVKNASV